jgi:MFS family permease
MIFPILANYYGRKKIIIFGILLGASSIIIGGVSINILMLVCCFFFTGFGLSGYETVVYVYITEISGFDYLIFNYVKPPDLDLYPLMYLL